MVRTALWRPAAVTFKHHHLLGPAPAWRSALHWPFAGLQGDSDAPTPHARQAADQRSGGRRQQLGPLLFGGRDGQPAPVVEEPCRRDAAHQRAEPALSDRAPQPPIFAGAENRNGRRKHDEIRFWSDCVAGAGYRYDDQGRSGGLASGARFVIAVDFADARPNMSSCAATAQRAVSIDH